MRVLDIVLLIIGAVCFAAEFFMSTKTPRTFTANLVALGLLAWILVPLITLLNQQ